MIAALRYRLWLMASLKFLLPFASLAAVAAYLSVRAPAPLLVLRPKAAKVVAPVGRLPLPAHSPPLLAWLAMAWMLGAAVMVKASPALLEPGLAGLWKPVVLIPAGLLVHLTAAERDAIANEMAKAAE